MKNVLLIGIYLFCWVLCAQDKHYIDSVNDIPFDIKTKKAATLDVVFLKNAADARKIRYKLGEAVSYSNLGIVYYYQGKYNLHVGNTLHAIRMFESLKAYDKLAYEYGILGYSMKRRNMPKALYYMQKGKAIAERNKDTTSLLSIYNNYGVLKEMKNELDSALYFYRKGLVIKEAVKDSVGIPFSINNIAGIYMMTGNYKQAEQLYDEALQMRLAMDDGVGIAENYTYFGDLYSTQKKYSKALGFYKQALARALQYNYIDLIQNSYRNIASNYEQLGNDKLALENYKKYSQYKDSLLNRDTNGKIAELEVQFETNKKEKLLAEHKNLLLKREAEAKQKNNLLIMLTLLTFFIALVGFLIYRQQKLKNRQQEQEHELQKAISKIETQNKLHDQRLSISRDLHDNIGAQLTFIISSIDNIKYAFNLNDTKLDSRLQSISTFTKETIIELRDTIWAMNTAVISLEDLMARIFNFIEKAKSAKENIRFNLSIDEQLSQLTLTSVTGMNIYRTIQEAVNNAIKYSQATDVDIIINSVDSKLSVTVSDNGVGFDPTTTLKGNGLLNMEKRIVGLGGTFKLDSKLLEGTRVKMLLDY